MVETADIELKPHFHMLPAGKNRWVHTELLIKLNQLFNTFDHNYTRCIVTKDTYFLSKINFIILTLLSHLLLIFSFPSSEQLSSRLLSRPLPLIAMTPPNFGPVDQLISFPVANLGQPATNKASICFFSLTVPRSFWIASVSWQKPLHRFGNPHRKSSNDATEDEEHKKQLEKPKPPKVDQLTPKSLQLSCKTSINDSPRIKNEVQTRWLGAVWSSIPTTSTFQTLPEHENIMNNFFSEAIGFHST